MQHPKVKTFLVTRGAGGLRSHPFQTLPKGGHEVVCADNVFTGTRRNVRHLIDHYGFEQMRHDVTCPLKVDEIDDLLDVRLRSEPA